jgi:hypothetical protein
MAKQNTPEFATRANYKMVVGIITCVKNADKIAAIKQTWVKDLRKQQVDYYFIIGDPLLTGCKIEKDILYVPCADTYESLLQKVYCFYKYVLENTTYDYVYKVDDDCFVNAELLYNTCFWNFNYFGRMVCVEEKELNRTWHFGKCATYTAYTGQYYGAWCGGGYGYFLSRKAIKEIVATAFTAADLYEDKAIGDALRMKNIDPEINEKYTAVDILELDSNNFKRSVFTDFVTRRSHLLFTSVVITEVRENFQFVELQNRKKIFLSLNA